MYNINQTAVSLEWSPPADAGGRNDVTYRVICRRCGWEAEECAPCGPNVGYLPAQSGLVETYASVVDLLAHANYTLEVEAVNGVSDLSRTQRLFAAVSIATGQAGELCSVCALDCLAEFSGHILLLLLMSIFLRSAVTFVVMQCQLYYCCCVSSVVCKLFEWWNEMELVFKFNKGAKPS